MVKVHKKRWLSIVALVILISMQMNCVIYALDEEGHTALLKSVLLGEKTSLQSYSVSAQTAIKALDKASSIMIDQFNHSKQKELDDLRENVSGLPDSISAIDYTSNSQEHRRNTHQGWDDFAYTTAEREKCNWTVRKEILQKTILQLWTKDTRKGEAFAKLVYYVHILGDYQYDKNQALKKLGVKEKAKTSDIENTDPDKITDEGMRLATYISWYKCLPSNYITKEEAEKYKYNQNNADISLEEILGGNLIGGDVFNNYEGHLPELENGEDYYECDISYSQNGRRNEKRIIFTKEGVVYYTDDHYETFSLILPKLYKQQYIMIGLGGRTDNYDITNELLKICEMLFETQTGSEDYMKLSRGIKAMNKDMGNVIRAEGGPNTNGRYLYYYGFADKLIDLLKRHIPRLLKNEEFFAGVVM